eukprot:Colp12_sorted_trinity150504_noHs@17019
MDLQTKLNLSLDEVAKKTNKRLNKKKIPVKKTGTKVKVPGAKKNSATKSPVKKNSNPKNAKNAQAKPKAAQGGKAKPGLKPKASPAGQKRTPVRERRQARVGLVKNNQRAAQPAKKFVVVRKGGKQAQQAGRPVKTTTIQRKPGPPLRSIKARSELASKFAVPAPVATQQRAAPRTRLIVKNLHNNVTANDLQELFGAIGPLVKAKLQRTAQGTSNAEVIYKTARDAADAVAKYNNRQLDGLPMKITLTTRVPDGTGKGPNNNGRGAGASKNGQPRFHVVL